MTNPSCSQWIALVAIFAAALMAGCATESPPLPPNNPADPQVYGSSRRPHNLLAPDETTLAIERQLNATQAHAASAEKMEHDMGNMPGMQHREMQSHEMHGQNVQSEKEALSEEMKKTAKEMKQTSEALKQKAEKMKTDATIYTCPVHPQVRLHKPGKCPICGMILVKKKQPHEEH
jgi:heavy metal-binding protein